MAGIRGRLRIHDLRHTLGIRLRRDRGVALETIMGILRHADIRETLIYAPYSLAEGRAAIRRLDGPMAVAAPADRGAGEETGEIGRVNTGGLRVVCGVPGPPFPAKSPDFIGK